MRKRQWQWILLFFCTTFVGCASVSGGGLRGIAFALLTAFLFAMACVQVTDVKNENTSEAVGDGGSTTKEASRDGIWQQCCENGKVSKCFCPSGAACNYGWMKDCGDGTCVERNGTCQPVSEPTPDTPKPDDDLKPDVKPDTNKPDGTWQQCCENGKVSKCFCPSGVACNYGQFKDCGSGVCISDPQGTCEPVAETVPDAVPETKPEPKRDGTWERCCQNGKVSKCFCPSGVACNYGQFSDCGNGTCIAGPVTSCEPVPEKEPVPETKPEPKRDGTWEQCCQNGKVSKCFCPAGLACNYGWYKDCGGGVCVPNPQGMCP